MYVFLDLDTQKLPSYTLSELLRLLGVRAHKLTDVTIRGRVLQLLASATGSGLVETFELRAVSAEGPRPAGQQQPPEASISNDYDATNGAMGDDELEIYDRSELNMYHDGLLFSRRSLPALLACLEVPVPTSGERGSTAEGNAWQNLVHEVLEAEVARLGDRVRRCAELSRAEARSARIEPSNELKCVQLQVRCSLLLLAALLRSPSSVFVSIGKREQFSSRLVAVLRQLPSPDSLARHNSYHAHIAQFRTLLEQINH